MEDCKILVTGGAGFIGSNLTDALLNKGYKVRVLDNFSTGKRENLIQAQKNPDFELLEGDIRDFAFCQEAVKGCSVVFHEAALGSVPRSIENPQRSLEVNVQGFLNVIESARLAGIKRFIYASSSSVYGDESRLPKIEECTGNALSPYALSKQIDEAIAENYARVYQFRSIGLRYFNVFGKRQDPDGAYAAAIPKFIKHLLRHEAPVINGDGSISRDFTYIENIVQANLLVMEKASSAAWNQTYNVAYGKQTSLNELFQALRSCLAEYDPEIAAIEPTYGPERAGDIPRSLASIEKIRTMLGFDPEYDVLKGLQCSAEWYFRNLK